MAALLFILAGTASASAIESVSGSNAPQATRNLASRSEATAPFAERNARAANENMVEEMRWEAQAPQTPGQKRFSRLQTDELAARLGFENGKADWMRVNLKDADGNGPALAGTFDGGAAMLKLRWKNDD